MGGELVLCKLSNAGGVHVFVFHGMYQPGTQNIQQEMAQVGSGKTVSVCKDQLSQRSYGT